MNNSITRHGVIYKLTNTINGKSYIGQTVNFSQRMRQHKNAGYALHEAIKKYGLNSFSVEFLFDGECTDSELNEMEAKAIREHGTKYPSGYNITDGGDGFRVGEFSEEHKRRLSEARTGRKFGAFTEEHKRRISEALTGKKRAAHSEETRQRRSQSITAWWAKRKGNE